MTRDRPPDTGPLWPSPVGPSGSDGRLPWRCLPAPRGWHPALSGRPAPVSPGASPRTRRQCPYSVCRASCPLPCLPPPPRLSGLRCRYPQAAPRQCRSLAARQPAPPRPSATEPLLWADWPRCQTRRDWLTLRRSQTVIMSRLSAPLRPEPAPPLPLSRAQRAHWRLSWSQRLQRHAAQLPTASLRLFGIPAPLAAFLGLPTA